MRLFILPILLLLFRVFAQDTMQVVKTSGPAAYFPLDSIDKITFTSTDMVVSGPNQNIAISAIQVILFNNHEAIGVENGKEDSLLSVENLSPNPFNPVTRMTFGLVRSGNVRVTVYDAAGRNVKELLDETLVAGNYQVAWNGTDSRNTPVSAGRYIVRLLLNGKAINKSAVFVK